MQALPLHHADAGVEKRLGGAVRGDDLPLPADREERQGQRVHDEVA
jgi:hypothetical protein